MLLAADHCFLYLHVSQKTALYRNTEKRLQQSSSRMKSFVFAAQEGRMDSGGFKESLSQANTVKMYSFSNTQSTATPGTTKAHQDLQCSAATSAERGGEPSLQPQKHLSCNMWPGSQHGWDWLLFTEECLCSSTSSHGKLVAN